MTSVDRSSQESSPGSATHFALLENPSETSTPTYQRDIETPKEWKDDCTFPSYSSGDRDWIQQPSVQKLLFFIDKRGWIRNNFILCTSIFLLVIVLMSFGGGFCTGIFFAPNGLLPITPKAFREVLTQQQPLPVSSSIVTEPTINKFQAMMQANELQKILFKVIFQSVMYGQATFLNVLKTLKTVPPRPTWADPFFLSTTCSRHERTPIL